MPETPSFRVYLTEHHDGRLSGVMMRWRERWIDTPAPSGYGRDEAEVLAEVEARLHEARALGNVLQRMRRAPGHGRRGGYASHQRRSHGGQRRRQRERRH